MGLTMVDGAQRDQVRDLVRPAVGDGDPVVDFDVVRAPADLTAVAIAGEDPLP